MKIKSSTTERLEQVFFYTLERSIKSYRQFAQRRLHEVNRDITIDQWLLLKTICDNPGISQVEMADRIFKDQASVTRIIELLVQKGLLKRSSHHTDRRRHSLELTEQGETTLEELEPIIIQNRNTALNGVDPPNIQVLKQSLEKIIQNCS